MKIIEKTTEFHIDEPTAIAIGKFDGIHMGHKKIFEKLSCAKKEGLKTVVFTFDPSPASFFSKESIKELSTKNEKRLLFEKMGIDYLVEYPFEQKTADVLPEDYVKDFLMEKMNGKIIVAGTDVSFGKGGVGDAALLEKMALVHDFQFVKVNKLKEGEREVSSSFVREEVIKGNMEHVKSLIGEAYCISGIVEEGKKLGRTLGMPTANIYPESEKLLPPNGVYFCDVEIEENVVYHGVTNIGCRPTVKDGNRVSVETYLLHYDGDLYGKKLNVRLLHFVRAERKFDSVDDLKNCVLDNIAQAEKYFS